MTEHQQRAFVEAHERLDRAGVLNADGCRCDDPTCESNLGHRIKILIAERDELRRQIVDWRVNTYRAIGPLMPETPDFGQIAQRIAELFGAVGDTEMKTYVAEQLRLVWNARGAADLAAFSSEDTPPCSAFELDAHEPSACRHCGWTAESHDTAAAIRRLDRKE